MSRINVKREYDKKWIADYDANITAKIEKERKKCGKWQVKWNGGAIHKAF